MELQFQHIFIEAYISSLCVLLKCVIKRGTSSLSPSWRLKEKHPLSSLSGSTGCFLALQPRGGSKELVTAKWRRRRHQNILTKLIYNPSEMLFKLHFDGLWQKRKGWRLTGCFGKWMLKEQFTQLYFLLPVVQIHHKLFWCELNSFGDVCLSLQYNGPRWPSDSTMLLKVLRAHIWKMNSNVSLQESLVHIAGTTPQASAT